MKVPRVREDGEGSRIADPAPRRGTHRRTAHARCPRRRRRRAVARRRPARGRTAPAVAVHRPDGPRPGAHRVARAAAPPGAGYRADLRTWSLRPAGGFLRFHLCLPAPVPVQWTPTLAAGLVDGRINCPISITVNGKPLTASYAETSASFHPVTWVIPAKLL
jgi:hypothetical protein